MEGGVDLAREKPLLGWGSGSFNAEYRSHERSSGREATAASHTIPITVAAEQGIIGLAAYVALLALAFVRLLRGARGSPVRAAIAAGFFALVLHTWLYAAFLEDPVTWTLLALGTALALAAGGARARTTWTRRRRSTAIAASRSSWRNRCHLSVSARSRFARPVELGATAFALAVAVLVWALTRTYPNYDSYYHLVWGRQLLDGLAPTFTAYAAPTQHPLYVALGAVLGAVFGESADRALVLVCLLSHALLVLGTYRLGAEVFGRWSGALAALFVAASASFLLYAARGYVDAPFLALVVWAGVRAASGRAPWVLLVLAGLLRPEAWVLTGLAWLARVPSATASGASRSRATARALVIAAPAIWALTDWAVTGDPLHSLNATSELADELGRVRGLEHVPGSFVTFVGDTVRLPVALLASLGVVLAVAHPRPGGACACRWRCSRRA